MSYQRGPYPEGDGVNMLIIAIIGLPVLAIWGLVQGLNNMTQYLFSDAPVAGIVVGAVLQLALLSLASIIAVACGVKRNGIRVIWGIAAYVVMVYGFFVWDHVFRVRDVHLAKLPQEFWAQNGFWMFPHDAPFPFGPMVFIGTAWLFWWTCRMLASIGMSPLADMYDAIVHPRPRSRRPGGRSDSAMWSRVFAAPKRAWLWFTEPWRVKPEPPKPPAKETSQRGYVRLRWEDDPDFH